MNMVKRWDIILIALLISLSFIPGVVFSTIVNKNYNATYIEITIDGSLYKKINLSEHSGEEEFNVVTEYGYNLIKIKDQSIAIIDADCPDKICEVPGFISKPGQTLVCLPHKLVVEVKGVNNNSGDEIIPVG